MNLSGNRTVFVDVSHYEPVIDYALYYREGYRLAVIKCIAGRYEDDKWRKHADGFLAAGVSIAPYIWDDLTVTPADQFAALQKAIEKYPIKFIMQDTEMYWKNWSDWSKLEAWKKTNKTTLRPYMEVATPAFIYDHCVALYTLIKTKSNYPWLGYNAKWFVDGYCPQLKDFYADKPCDWADYTYYNSDKKTIAWKELPALLPPPSYKLRGYGKVAAHQVSGDKFQLPGFYSNDIKTRLAGMDINIGYNDVFNFKFDDKPVVTEPIIEDVVDHFTREVFASRPMKVLNVPFVSQLGVGADEHRNDCGAASACMLIGSYKAKTPTVDEFYNNTGMTYDGFLTAAQVIKVLESYSVSAKWQAGLKLDDLFQMLRAKRPVICLVGYGYIADAIEVESTFRGSHFLVVVGMDAHNVYVHDPLFAEDGFKAIPIDDFEKAWKNPGANNSWNAVIVPDYPMGSSVQCSMKYKVTAWDGVNIRSTPAALKDNSNKVGALGWGKTFFAESVNNGWAKVLGERNYIYVIGLAARV